MARSATLSRADEMFARRQRRIKEDGSPPYRYALGVVVAAASVDFDVGQQFPDSRKYAPLDWIEIYNNDVVDITITINGTIQLPIAGGAVRKVDNQALWHILITNNDALVATTANQIILTLQREAMNADKAARGNG